jgi:hypothetical protein
MQSACPQRRLTAPALQMSLTSFDVSLPCGFSPRPSSSACQRVYHCHQRCCIHSYRNTSLSAISPLSNSTMAFEAITLLQFIMIATWTCLLETPNKNKNSLFVRFFQSREDVENILSTLSMSFAPGLFEVLVCTTPPTLRLLQDTAYSHHEMLGGLCHQPREG